MKALGFLLCLLIAGGAMLAKAPSASACSCLESDPASFLANTHASFIGTYVEGDVPFVEGESNWATVGHRFTIESWLKGPFTAAEMVVASTGEGGSTCGIELSPGDRVAVFLTKNHLGAPLGSSCGSMDAEFALSQLQTEGVAPTPAEPKEVEEAAGADGAPTQQEDIETNISVLPLVASIAGVALVGGLGFVLWRKRQQTG